MASNTTTSSSEGTKDTTLSSEGIKDTTAHPTNHPVVVGIIKANYNDMNVNNKKAANVMLTKGPDAAASFMLESCGMDYAAMRAKYG